MKRTVHSEAAVNTHRVYKVEEVIDEMRTDSDMKRKLFRAKSNISRWKWKALIENEL